METENDAYVRMVIETAQIGYAEHGRGGVICGVGSLIYISLDEIRASRPDFIEDDDIREIETYDPVQAFITFQVFPPDSSGMADFQRHTFEYPKKVNLSA